MDKFVFPKMHELLLMQVRAERAMRAVVSRQIESQRLTMMEWLTLGVISSGSKKGLSMTEISKHLDVTLPQVTVLVAGLLRLKYAKQQTLAQDHRGKQVTITLKGRRILAKIDSTLAKALRRYTKTIPEDRLHAYVRTIEQLSEQND